MITRDTLTDYIKRAMPDAIVTMTDKTGTMDHLKVTIVSDAFQGKTLLDRHRLIYQALDAPMKDGRIHLVHKAEHAIDLETGAISALRMRGKAGGSAEPPTATRFKVESRRPLSWR